MGGQASPPVSSMAKGEGDDGRAKRKDRGDFSKESIKQLFLSRKTNGTNCR
jgi:hypothetical protein